MTVRRFPRAAFVRRVENLAYDLSLYADYYGGLVTQQDIWDGVEPQALRFEELRAIIHDTYQLAAAIEDMRRLS